MSSLNKPRWMAIPIAYLAYFGCIWLASLTYAWVWRTLVVKADAATLFRAYSNPFADKELFDVLMWVLVPTVFLLLTFWQQGRKAILIGLLTVLVALAFQGFHDLSILQANHVAAENQTRHFTGVAFKTGLGALGFVFLMTTVYRRLAEAADSEVVHATSSLHSH